MVLARRVADGFSRQNKTLTKTSMACPTTTKEKKNRARRQRKDYRRGHGQGMVALTQ